MNSFGFIFFRKMKMKFTKPFPQKHSYDFPCHDLISAVKKFYSSGSSLSYVKTGGNQINAGRVVTVFCQKSFYKIKSHFPKGNKDKMM
jgi:hypothetical protein